MNAKKRSSSSRTKEAAGVAECGSESMHDEYAAKMQSEMAKLVGVSAGKITARLERRAKAMTELIEKRPVETALITLAIGMMASRRAAKRAAEEPVVGKAA